jgi:hypothetical protein
MSVLELKGSLMDMISSVQNEETLERLVNLFRKTVHAHEPDWWDDLSPQQQRELEEALAECDNPANLISHEEATKQIDRWLKE